MLGRATGHWVSLVLHLGWRTGAHEPTAGLTQGGLGSQPCGSAISSSVAQSGYGEVCPGSWLLAPGVDVVIAVGVSGRGPEHVLGGLLVWVTYREFRSTCGTWRLCRVIPPPHHPRSLSLLTCEVDTLVVPPRGLLKG